MPSSYTHMNNVPAFLENEIYRRRRRSGGRKKSEFYVFIPIFVTLPQHTVLGLGGCRMSMPKADFFPFNTHSTIRFDFFFFLSLFSFFYNASLFQFSTAVAGLSGVSRSRWWFEILSDTWLKRCGLLTQRSQIPLCCSSCRSSSRVCVSFHADGVYRNDFSTTDDRPLKSQKNQNWTLVWLCI